MSSNSTENAPIDQSVWRKLRKLEFDIEFIEPEEPRMDNIIDDKMDETKPTIEEVRVEQQARYIANGGTCFNFICGTPGRADEWTVNCTECGIDATVTCATACLCQGARDFRAWCPQCDKWVTCRPAWHYGRHKNN